MSRVQGDTEHLIEGVVSLQRDQSGGGNTEIGQERAGERALPRLKSAAHKPAKTILFAGGGTGGPVTPLLAIAEVIKAERPELNLIFVGGNSGPERKLAEGAGLKFYSIPTVKWRRYFSWTNIYDLFVLPIAVAKSMLLLIRHGVGVVVNAGSYVGVPVIWAAWLLRRKILIHHQDIELSLSTKLTMPLASSMSVVFPEQKKYSPYALVAGNPVRNFLSKGNRHQGLDMFKLDSNRPVVFVFGGGGGSLRINELIEASVNGLLDRGVQVIHQTGRHVSSSYDFLAHISPGYYRIQFLTTETPDAYAAADIVVSRAGLANISELSYLGKTAIIIPIPDSHQEANARLLAEKNAAVVLNEKELSGEKLSEEIIKLIQDKEKQKVISQNIFNLMPHGAANTIAQLVYKLL